MRTPVALLAAALAVALPAPGRAAGESAGRRAEEASLRFAWPAPARARVDYRRTRLRTGQAPRVFTASYDLLTERAPDGDGIGILTRRTSWRGALPVPRALSREAIRASERVVQRIGPEGEFRGLEGVEALRPVLARALGPGVEPGRSERALALALASTRAEAEELWNLAVGFWTGADLRIGETYAMQSEAELPLLPGERAAQAVEFRVRRRVPCSLGERPIRCVEAVLRATPDPTAIARAGEALLARILPEGAAPPAGGARDLAVESELVLVTDPATLLPRKLVWTRAVRLRAAGEARAAAEHVDRAEYEYRWQAPARPSARSAPGRTRPPAP